MSRVLPPIPSALLISCKRPYRGPIVPGSIFAWEPDLLHARTLCLVTDVRDGLVYSTDLDYSNEVHNDESRFREACVPTLFQPWPTEKPAVGSIPDFARDFA